MLLTNPDSLQSADRLYIGENHTSLEGAFLFGGKAALSDRVADQVSEALNLS